MRRNALVEAGRHAELRARFDGFVRLILGKHRSRAHRKFGARLAHRGNQLRRTRRAESYFRRVHAAPV